MDSYNIVKTQGTEGVIKKRVLLTPVEGEFYDKVFTFIALLIFPVPIAFALNYFLDFTMGHNFFAGANIIVLLLFICISLILTICIYTKNRDAYIYSLGVGYIFTIIFLVYMLTGPSIESPIFLIVFLIPFCILPFYIIGILFRALINKGKILGTIFSVIIFALLIIASQFIN